MLFGIYFTFDSSGKLWYKLNATKLGKRVYSMDIDAYTQRILAENEKNWKKTCRLLFCCTKAERSKDNVLWHAAKTFSDYFCAYTDLVPSDILAGMILLRQKQKYEESTRIEEELKNTNASYHQVWYIVYSVGTKKLF